MKYLIVMTLSACLAACGLKGPLYLPKEDAATAKPASQPQADDADTKENKKEKGGQSN
jgi:predicted small lipoprotein YifL